MDPRTREVRSRAAIFRRRACFVGGTAHWSDLPAALAALAAGSRGAEQRIKVLHAALSAYLGVPHVFTYGAGRMALYEALRAMDVGEGDEVIVPGFTCAVVVNAVRFAGAVPVYTDIELARLGPDPTEVRRLITPRTRAIVAHHLFGLPCRIDEILEIGRSHAIPVIEDAAMALGGRHDGRLLGTLGAAGVYSSERTKMISTGNGGILVTSDPRLAERIDRRYGSLPCTSDRQMRLSVQKWILNYLTGSVASGEAVEMIIRQIKKVRRSLGLPWDFACETFDRALYEDEWAGRRLPGYPWRLHGGLAGLAVRQLRRIERQIDHRCELATALGDILSRKGAAVPEFGGATMRPAWLRFPFWVDDLESWARRLRRAGIECHSYCRWFEGPIHPATCASNPWFRYEPGMCPRGEWLGKRILNIPLVPRIGSWLLRRIARL